MKKLEIKLSEELTESFSRFDKITASMLITELLEDSRINLNDDLKAPRICDLYILHKSKKHYISLCGFDQFLKVLVCEFSERIE